MTSSNHSLLQGRGKNDVHYLCKQLCKKLCNAAFWGTGCFVPAPYLQKSWNMATLCKSGVCGATQSGKSIKPNPCQVMWRQFQQLHDLFCHLKCSQKHILANYLSRIRSFQKKEPPCWSDLISGSTQPTSDIRPIRCRLYVFAWLVKPAKPGSFMFPVDMYQHRFSCC